jgi:putative Holliday junction resolvase
MRELPHTHSCFVCGESNAVGLKLRFTTDGRVVHTRFRLRAEHIGFRGVVHGGILATVLDEIMVWACAVPTGQFAFCAELNVRFLNPVRPDDEIIATGELLANRKNRIFEAKGVLANSAGRPFAEATGKYLPIAKGDLTGIGDCRNPFLKVVCRTIDSMRILALDHGTKRIGVAVSDETKTIAQPLEFIPAEPFADFLERLKQLIREKEVDLILIGLPRNMDGSYGPAAQKVEAFVAVLRSAVTVPIKSWDERLTSAQANRILIEGRVRREKRKAKVDQMAAAILLQSYLDGI